MKLKLWLKIFQQTEVQDSMAPQVNPIKHFSSVQFSSVQSLIHVRLFATPWIATRQASLSISNSWSLLKLMSIESVMPSNHLILCHPLLLLPPVPPSIIVFSNESTLLVRWPKYWSFSFSISPSSKYSFREELIPSLTSGKLQKEGHSQAYSTRPPSITLIPNQTKISQKKKITGQYHQETQMQKSSTKY